MNPIFFTLGLRTALHFILSLKQAVLATFLLLSIYRSNFSLAVSCNQQVQPAGGCGFSSLREDIRVTHVIDIMQRQKFHVWTFNKPEATVQSKIQKNKKKEYISGQSL